AGRYGNGVTGSDQLAVYVGVRSEERQVMLEARCLRNVERVLVLVDRGADVQRRQARRGLRHDERLLRSTDAVAEDRAVRAVLRADRQAQLGVQAERGV